MDFRRVIVFGLLFFASPAFAITYTANLNLCKPAKGDVNYVDCFAAGMDYLDAAIADKRTGKTASILATWTFSTSPIFSNPLSVASATLYYQTRFVSSDPSKVSTITASGDLNWAGTITASVLAGSGMAITNLDASNLVQGTVGDARLSSLVSLLGQSIDINAETTGDLELNRLNGLSTTYVQASSTDSFIQNRNTLQSGSTFYVSSGSVTGTFTSYGGILGNLTGNVTGISAGTTLLGGATSYLPYSSNLPGGSTSYIQVSTSPTGGTFHASSGTVDGTMTATGGFTGTASNASNLEGTDLGTLTDTKYCTYDLAGTEIDCNADVSGMTPGATYYLNISNTLQAGSTVYASSGSFHNTAFLGRNTITSGVGAVFGYPATWTDDQSNNAPVAWEVRRDNGVPGAWLDWYSGWTSPSLKIGQGGVGGNASLVVTGNQTTGFNAIFTGNAGAMDYTVDDPNWRIGFCSNHVHGASCINNGRIKGGYLDAAANGGWRLGWDAINSSGDYYQWLAVKTNTSATTEVGIDAKLCVGCGSLTTPVSSKFDVLNGSITVRGTGTGLRVQALASCGTIGTDAQGSMTCGTGGFSELSSTQTFTGQNTFSNLVTFSSNTIGVFQTFASSIAVFGANPPTSFTDVDLSPWVGKRTAVVMLRVGLYYTGTGTNVCSFRTNGAVGIGYGYSGSNISMVTRNSPQIGELMIRTDSNGVIEYQCETGSGYTIEIIVDAAWF